MTADVTSEAGRTESYGSDLESSAMKPGSSSEDHLPKGSKDPLTLFLAPFEHFLMGLGCMSPSPCMGPKDPLKEPPPGPVRLAHRAPWVRAGLLGAQDGLVSVSSLIIGVGAISGSRSSMVVSGLAGLVAGACSMAIGEYVSVKGQRDIEEADLAAEKEELAKGPEAEARGLEELTQLYVLKGLSYPLARQVALELSAKEAMGAHARDELDVDADDDLSNPVQAATASGVSFIVGAVVPLVTSAFVVTDWLRILVVCLVSSLMFLLFGFIGAWLGGARPLRASMRTLLGGWLALAITFAILKLCWLLGIHEAVV